VAAQYPGQVSFVSENFGASKLAERFGVKGYPSVFIDDVLFASPRDFGVFNNGQGAGRYSPWRNAESQKRFQNDLSHMVELILAGRKDIVKKEHAESPDAFREITQLPKLQISDLAGRPIDARDLEGKPVVVEFWATWCLPCRSTLDWLAALKSRYGERLAVVALAVESPDDAVRSMAGTRSQEIRWAIPDGPTAQSFGNITAVPTMFVFDKSGRQVKVIYGAPPDLHEQVSRILDRIAR
jgi:thiol-disulfide isomerase/thioredoxin